MVTSTPKDSPIAITCNDLSKVYRSLGSAAVEALAGISLEISQGEIFGLLGPNGAGKTTTVKIILGLCRPSSGSVTVMGAPAGSMKALRRIGYLPERARPPLHLTGRGVLHYYAALSGVSRAGRRAAAQHWLQAVGLGRRGDDRVSTYSKGMVQRLGVAQALVHNPDLLILDEPTDGLDPVGRREMRELIFAQKAAGKTVFLNSHLLQELEMCCDRVAILDRGRIVRHGSLSDLLERKLEYRLELSGLAKEHHQGLEEVSHGCVIAADGDEVTLQLAREADLDSVIDHLRATGVRIRALVPLRHTLEEVFVDALGRHRKPSATPGAAPAKAQEAS